MHEPLDILDPESTLPDPVAAAAARADLAALWRAIGELPRRQRKALLLREFSGLSYGELADALAVSEPTVQSLLFRARRDLRARLRPVSGSLGSLAPLAAIREALARSIGGMPDPLSAGPLAGLSSMPLVAKLAAAVAVVAIAGGTVATVKVGSVGHATPSAQAATPATPNPTSHSTVASGRARTVSARARRHPGHVGHSPPGSALVLSVAAFAAARSATETSAKQPRLPVEAPAQADQTPVASPQPATPASAPPAAEQPAASSPKPSVPTGGGVTSSGGDRGLSSSPSDDPAGISASSDAPEPSDEASAPPSPDPEPSADPSESAPEPESDPAPPSDAAEAPAPSDVPAPADVPELSGGGVAVPPGVGD